ncbi:Aste57867_2869 [Aphanomyces stellatus]|uniref:Aste57867_2869 protein n=1 Tax=Aphanomyces stellatus TaxID=120398 RepID=A0A485KE68_9STRA|nr:hypothetical protein As57867_002861 [Aphanomyces stellatus]VFT80055.1 Aste57867_2869 [Aphanomyces stellatus]
MAHTSTDPPSTTSVDHFRSTDIVIMEEGDAKDSNAFMEEFQGKRRMRILGLACGALLVVGAAVAIVATTGSTPASASQGSAQLPTTTMRTVVVAPTPDTTLSPATTGWDNNPLPLDNSTNETTTLVASEAHATNSTVSSPTTKPVITEAAMTTTVPPPTTVAVTTVALTTTTPSTTTSLPLTTTTVSPPTLPPRGVGALLTKDLYAKVFPNALPIYQYDNLVAVAAKYPSFANSGNVDNDKREVAAFLGQLSLESGDLTHVEELHKTDMCQPSATYPCASGKQYYGRGPLQLSWNYNYADFGKVAGKDLVENPELVATDADLVWLSAMWFWNAPKWNGNIHDVVGKPGGFAKATFIINVGLECGVNPPNKDSEKARIASFKKFCDLLGVAPGDNLSCQTAQFNPKP